MGGAAARCDGAELCDEFLSTRDSTFTATYCGDPPSREVFSMPGLRLVVDMSPLVRGHLLLLPECHYLSFGHLMPDLAAQVTGLVGRLLPLYRAAFGDAVILEHGSSSTMPSACITHAHWHIAPLDGRRLRAIISEDGLKPLSLDSSVGLHRFAEADRPYYYCSDGTWHVAFDAQQAPRAQYLRSVMGSMLDIPDPEWDWSLIVRKHLLRATLHTTRGWRDRLAPRPTPHDR